MKLALRYPVEKLTSLNTEQGSGLSLAKRPSFLFRLRSIDYLPAVNCTVIKAICLSASIHILATGLFFL